MTKLWMVRAGRGGVFMEDFVENGRVAIGFGERAGILEDGVSREEVTERYRKLWPDKRDGQITSAASQLYRFHREVRVGDSVVTYDSNRRQYLIGEITGAAEFVEDKAEDASYRRTVKWTGKADRDELSVGTRNTLGSIMTIFLVNESAAAELEAKTRPIDAAEPDAQTTKPRSEATGGDADTIGDLRAEVAEKANEFIEDLIAKLGPYEMQDLVAGVLRAMGYKTRVSPQGSDRGIDIFASPDGLGLQEPRVFVEVKHRLKTSMGSQEIRSFLGGRQAGDRCLYVSTGGFTKEARYEAERSSIPLTLLDLAALRQLVVEHYENLDIETRRLVPLTRLYWPVGGA